MLVCVLLVAAFAGQPAWADGQQSDATQRQAEVTPEPVPPAPDPAPDPAPPAPAPDPVPPVEPPDPTPEPDSEPPPVGTGVPATSPEIGAETLASPTVSDIPVPTAPADTAAPEHSITLTLPGADPPSSEPTVKAAPAQTETASPGSLGQFAKPPGTPGEPPAADPQTPGGPPPGESPPGGGPTDPTDPRAPDARNGDIPGVPGAPPGAAPGTSASTIVAGPTLPAAARDIVTQRPGAGTSGSSSRDAAGVGRLRQPTSLGLSQVADLVKDIPAWIKLALAGTTSLVLLLGAYTVLAAARTRRLERHRSKLMEDIGLLQAALLPAVPGRLGALLTTVAYRPAEGPAAGGDFYDAFALSDSRVGLLLGDISGHGRQALAKTTLVRFTVRAHLEAGLSPREALAISGRSLDGRLSDDFATVIAAIHDPIKGTLTYASAGHPPPLVVGPPAHDPVTASSAPPIGAGFPTGQRQTVLPMPEGSTVCVYSDGLFEARVDGDLLGRDRLGAWLEELGPEATAKALLDLVVGRAERVPDDLAACILHAAPGATAPAARVEQLKLDVLDIEGPELEGFLEACGVSHADRTITGRRVSEQLAVSGGVVVEVRIGEHPMVSVASIGDHASGGSRPVSRVR